jgi:hypothetical protein
MIHAVLPFFQEMIRAPWRHNHDIGPPEIYSVPHGGSRASETPASQRVPWVAGEKRCMAVRTVPELHADARSSAMPDTTRRQWTELK